MSKPVLPELQICATPGTTEQLNRSNPHNFLQQFFWGEHKAGFGWRHMIVELTANIAGIIQESTTILVLERSLGGGLSFLYLPHGPEEPWIATLQQKSLNNRGIIMALCARAIQGQASQRPIFIRFDLPWIIGDQPCLADESAEARFSGDILRGNLDYRPLRKAAADIQPPDTVILNLTVGADMVLASMKAKTRYNIRLAEKKGVLVKAAGMEQFDAWYDLYRITAERDHISVHSAQYYRTLFERNSANMELLLAYHETDLLAGTIMMYAGNTATYLYGASSNLKRNFMPAYALQWIGIQSAIKRGCSYYDFGGVPPTNNLQHAMHGLFQFKTGFGGNLVSMPGCWDFPYQKILYSGMGIAEKMRHFYFKKVKKRR